ncbi:MAG: hypothetical protein GXO25_00710 [Euryarchaeota archaeon]|nr:hypothetical protein [Euryarchaeota archaeon]
MLEVNVKKEIFNELKNMNDYDFNVFLKNKLRSLIMELDMNSEEKLLAKKKEIQERFTKIMEELTELTEFCERAEKDKELMEEWIEKLDKENEELLKELKS